MPSGTGKKLKQKQWDLPSVSVKGNLKISEGVYKKDLGKSRSSSVSNRVAVSDGHSHQLRPALLTVLL